MRRLILLCVMSTGCAECDPSSFVTSNVHDISFGEALPSPLVLSGRPFRAGMPYAQLERYDRQPDWFARAPVLEQPFLPLWTGQAIADADTPGLATEARFLDPIVPPQTGLFVLRLGEDLTTAPFYVGARNPAYVTCLDATVLAGAAAQDPTPYRGRIGSCTMTRSGGDTVGRSIGQASCTTAKGRSDCTYDPAQSACVGAPIEFAQRRAPGDAVSLAWSGGDVLPGSVELVVPAAVELGVVSATHPMTDDLEVQFTGGTAGAELRMTLSQTTTGSQVVVDCDVDAATGRVVLPKVWFGLLEAGEAALSFTVASTKRVSAGNYEVEASAPGLVRQNGVLIGSLPLTLSP